MRDLDCNSKITIEGNVGDVELMIDIVDADCAPTTYAHTLPHTAN